MDRNNGLDDIDRAILEVLQTDGRITNVKLARAVGLSQASALERVRKLEERGFIEAYRALVNPERVGRATLAWALVSLSFHKQQSVDSFMEAISRMEDVLECYHVTGEDDFLLKVLVPDMGAYRELLLDLLSRNLGVSHVKTMMVLGTTKRETRVPLSPSASPRRPRRRPGSRASRKG
ncbi:MAG: Lrp/AsnC family transcriptional regulator [Polyangia bacterium]|jgi:Lrp/AsnC family leucine-responsive transcriptional regulator|nr:Lrp/AsnC family transcriptional regulator [Polyangia bacterium]